MGVVSGEANIRFMGVSICAELRMIGDFIVGSNGRFVGKASCRIMGGVNNGVMAVMIYEMEGK